jgi:HemY protein
VLAAEASHALQDRFARDEHLRQALDPVLGRTGQDVSEGVQMRAARWALDERDVVTALERLEALPQGAARRTIALRMRLKAARLGGQTRQALETTRLLAKHRAFSEAAAQSLVRGLAQELLSGAHDPEQLLRAWGQLDADEQLQPDVALHAAQRLQSLGGDVAQSLNWVLPIWTRMVERPQALSENQRVKIVQVLQLGLQAAPSLDGTQWLARVESAHKRQPSDANLQYLAGMVCVVHRLWGKGQQLLEQAVPKLGDTALKRQAWRTLAQLAEQRGDLAGVHNAHCQAAML